MMEVNKETGGGIYLTIEEVAPHGEEPDEIVIKDQVIYHAGVTCRYRLGRMQELTCAKAPLDRDQDQTMEEMRIKRIMEKMTPWKGRATK